MDQANLAVIAIGGDLRGDFANVEALLEAALERFASRGLVIVKRSSWWRSAAWPDPDQPEYRNAVLLVEARPPANEMLHSLLAIETAFGRRRVGANRPRTLDLDLIDHSGQVIAAPGLILPHPRAHERLFVMGPLAEIAPDWRHPVSGRTARDLAASAPVGRDATPL